MTPIILGVVSAFLSVALITGAYLAWRFLFSDDNTTNLVIRDYRGMTLAEARKIIDEIYFDVETDPEELDNEEEWIIVEQTPSAGDERKIEVGKHKCRLTFTLKNNNDTEDQIYLTYDETIARRVTNELRELGFKNIKTAEEYSSTVKKGHVTRTDPAEDQYVSKDTVITIYVSLGPASGTDQTVFVPNFDGMTETAAKNLAAEKGFTVKVEQKESSFAKGTVVGQDPVANTEVAPGTEVTIYISTGVGGVVVPDLKDKFEANAKADVEKLGLRAVVKYVASTEAARGIVVSQDPAARTSASAGSAVTIFVSGGPNYSDGSEENTLKAPNIVGQTEADAKRFLSFYDLTLGNRTEQYSDKPKGTIIAQTPKAGDLMGSSKSISYVVSLGPAPTTEYITMNGIQIPNIVGMSYERALEVLRANFLDAGKITYVDSNHASGTVVAINGVRTGSKRDLVDFSVSN